MARSFAVVALIVSAFCFSSVLAARVAPNAAPNVAPNATANGDDFFIVVGKIYCDPCQFQFQSRLSKPLEGNNNNIIIQLISSSPEIIIIYMYIILIYH